MDVNELVQMVFSWISPLVIEDVVDEGERVVVRARTPKETAVCPVCGGVGACSRLLLADSARRAGRRSAGGPRNRLVLAVKAAASHELLHKLLDAYAAEPDA
ncbi:hypothetical protein ACFWSF_35770, partial [Streptomyces sp. NPDC058611]